MPVTRRSFEKRLVVLHQTTPGLADFELHGSELRRSTDLLLQVIEFQPGTGAYTDRFTFNSGWKLLLDEHTSLGFLCWHRPQHFLGGANIWYSRANADRLQQSMEHLARGLESAVLPFLDAHDSVQGIISHIESGATEPGVVFGMEPVRQAYAHGRCLEHLGRNDEAHGWYRKEERKHNPVSRN